MRVKATSKSGNTIKDFITTRIVLFMVITFFFTIILAILQEALTIDYQYITLPQWGPGIAALLLGFTLYKNTLNESLKIKGIKTYKLVVSTLLPFGLIAVSFVFFNTYHLSAFNLETIESTFFYIIIPATLFGAIGEALGWRVFLQSSISRRFNHTKAAVLVGILWGLWHVGHYANGFVFMIFFLIFTISFSLVISFLIRVHTYNLVYASAFHFGANLGFYIFFRSHVNDTSMIIINAVIWLLGAIFVLLMDKKLLNLTHADKGI